MHVYRRVSLVSLYRDFYCCCIDCVKCIDWLFHVVICVVSLVLQLISLPLYVLFTYIKPFASFYVKLEL